MPSDTTAIECPDDPNANNAWTFVEQSRAATDAAWKAAGA